MHRNNTEDLSERRSLISEVEPSLEMSDNKENIVGNIMQFSQPDGKPQLMLSKP